MKAAKARNASATTKKLGSSFLRQKDHSESTLSALASHAAERLVERIKHLRRVPGSERQRRTQPAAHFSTDSNVHSVTQSLARQRHTSIEAGAVECQKRSPAAHVGYERGVLRAELLET